MCIRDSATTAVVACEASGGLEHDVVSILTQAGHRVRIVDAGQVRHFARSFGRKAKTDQIDAVMIARYATTIEGRITVPDARKRGKTPGKLWKVSPCCDSGSHNDSQFPPFRRGALDHAAPACPGFCPSYGCST